ncbi:hypothetical protein NLM59_01725 [Weeksellaceae bacterium KMM 9724]|uniref:hypothetical protein n=1 Tax=Profundicola chukchiensis TaxID=2961959 RepID=UPI00243B2C32|nr:hypothetical protein [Profundicola chukchiensis]MDG4949630.1 hypothetical protein [Profundicola chukchiensis]
MKGRSRFTQAEANEIESLINQKLLATAVKQKSIRAKIRRLGFYASDFGLGGGYSVSDFRRVVTIDGGQNLKEFRKVKSERIKLLSKNKAHNDEAYIIDLCDIVLQSEGIRQHRFDFLRGDTGVKLPVDCYYPNLNLVIEYYERQHSETVKFFDKRMTSSGISRGEQRKRYDDLRKTELPKNGIKLIIFDYSEFQHRSNKRLIRNSEEDFKIVSNRLKGFIINDNK